MLFTLLQEFVSANSARAAYDDQKHAVLLTRLNEVQERLDRVKSLETEQKRVDNLETRFKRLENGWETQLNAVTGTVAETKNEVIRVSRKLDVVYSQDQTRGPVRRPPRPAAAQQNTNSVGTTRPPGGWQPFSDQFASLQANIQRYLSSAQSLCNFAKIQCSVLDGC
jgi:hypothetical protein